MHKCNASKMKIIGNTFADNNTKDVVIAVPLKYLSNFWRTLEIPLISCETNFLLTWSLNCVITYSTGARIFARADIKLYVPVITLSTQDNAKLLQQLKVSFKRTINWNKYLPKVEYKTAKPYLDKLIDPSFQGVNRLFVLPFEISTDKRWHTEYYHPKVKINDYNVMIDGRNFFDQPINNDIKTYENISKIATCQGDGYTTGCLLDYPHFKENYKITAIDLSKQQTLDADPRAIQQINFTGNLDWVEGAFVLFNEEERETVLGFSQETVRVL